MAGYIVNEKTRTLHIKGMCAYAQGKLRPNYKGFRTEAAAQAYYEGNLKVCKKCQNKRDR